MLKKAGAAAIAAASVLALGSMWSAASTTDIGRLDSEPEDNLALFCGGAGGAEINVIALPILSGNDSSLNCVSDDDQDLVPSTHTVD